MAKKYVRPFTPAWRWAIAVSSIGTFVGGWAVVAHMPNPYQTASAAASDAPVIRSQDPAPDLNQAPLPSVRNRSQRQFRQLPSSGSSQDTFPQLQPDTGSQQPLFRTSRLPRMRSGGS